MDILNLYDKLKGSYKDYLESFVTIKDKRIEERFIIPRLAIMD